MGFTISSTNLKGKLILIDEGKVFNVFNNNSCFKESLLSNTLIIGIIISLSKFIDNSLKYAELSISDIRLLTVGSSVSFVIDVAIDFISLLSLDISLIVKGN